MALHSSINDGKEQSHHLSLLQRLNIAIDVASALHYLHHLSVPPTIHCNLKPSNVLLGEDMVAHVSDFGRARLLSSSEMHTSTICLQGMVGYAPPEYGTGSAASKEGDVFKDGLNLRELVKAALPEELPMLLDPSTSIYGEADGIDQETVKAGETTEAAIKEKQVTTEKKRRRMWKIV
ncbi:Probable LRR receptor-like serine/threonine-protein kinase At3g47570 [Linum grandiflorum]